MSECDLSILRFFHEGLKKKGKNLFLFENLFVTINQIRKKDFVYRKQDQIQERFYLCC
jgi:hypothetical protein